MSDDGVDRILEQWANERPELDTEAMGVLGRIQRTAAAASAAMGRSFAHYDMTGADFDVLATLRRSGEPYALSPGQLTETLMLTSGGMTGRLKRLERTGLVERTDNPADGRGRKVTLTSEGFRLIDAALDAAVATQNRLLSGMPKRRRQQLSDLLREALAVVSQEAALPERPPIEKETITRDNSQEQT